MFRKFIDTPNISKNIEQEITDNKKKFYKKKIISSEFIIHLILLVLSSLTIIKLKFKKVNSCNYLILLPDSNGEIDYRSKYIINYSNLKKNLNLARSTNFLNSIKFYFRCPNVVFFLTLEYFCSISINGNKKAISKLKKFHLVNMRLKFLIKKIFMYVGIKKFISIDDQRVMVLFLEICSELSIKSIGYMHYKFNDYYQGIKYNAFDIFFVWSNYFKKKLIRINKKYKKKHILIVNKTIEKFKLKKNRKKIKALLILDLNTDANFLFKLIMALKKEKINLAVKFKPSSKKDFHKWLIFCKKNDINYFLNSSFLQIIKIYKVDFFIAFSSTALYEACLFGAEPLIIRNKSYVSSEIISEGIINSCNKNIYSIIKKIRQGSSSNRVKFYKKKFWSGKAITNRKIAKVIN